MSKSDKLLTLLVFFALASCLLPLVSGMNLLNHARQVSKTLDEVSRAR